MVKCDKYSNDSINNPCHRYNTVRRIMLILFVTNISISFFLVILFLNTNLLALKDFYFFEEIICVCFIPISLIFNKYITVLPIKKADGKVTVFPYFLIMVIIGMVITFCFMGNRLHVSNDYSRRIVYIIIIIFYLSTIVLIMLTNRKYITIKRMIIVLFFVMFPSIFFSFSCLYVTTSVEGERGFADVLEIRVQNGKPSNKYYATILYRDNSVNEIGINKYHFDNIVAGNPISAIYKKAIFGVEFVELKTNIGD